MTSVFTSALVATDLGPSSEGIVACAGALRSIGVRDAVLVHVIDLEHGPSSADDVEFERQVESLEAAGIRTHVETPFGYPPHAIASLAVERGVGLIVMGTHGQGLFHTGFSGSISSDVIRLSPAPVLLAPSTVAVDAETGKLACARLLSSVLVPTDLVKSADPACALTFDLAERGIGRLEILHVVEMSFEANRNASEARTRTMLDMLATRARAANVRDVNTTIARGEPDEIVPRLAASGQYSVIVLAPRCHDTIDRAFDSVTSAVIRESSTPLLLTPPGCEQTYQPLGNT
ncbi:MAG: universal stress protein [Coriobacteriia bacterium]|nr:universal stress protein [Coriobacteriia bacterium]